ncbi:MAG: RdgB/HAM1 family non-canonical purine NTP pyrophosphatase [Pseudomonadota bacterium]
MSRRLDPGHLLVASHNAGKLREIADLVGPYGLEAVSAVDFGLPEPDETEDSFEGNALLKARAAAEASDLVALADDSGLAVEALGGAPGIYSARWAQTPEGRDFGHAMAKVQEILDQQEVPQPRRAAFVCVLALVWPNGESTTFRGAIEGQLVWPPRGTRGFGYDPMFLPEGRSQTFGEMDPTEKHAISHRARAFRRLVDSCLAPVD